MVLVAVLMVKPAKLLKHLGMFRISFEDFMIGALGFFGLLLLLVDVTDLEPDVCLIQGRRRRSYNVFEALWLMLAAVTRSVSRMIQSRSARTSKLSSYLACCL